MLVGLVVLAVLVLEPQVEGRNVDATLVEIYLHDPFLLFVYTGSIPFFLALFEAFKLLGYVETSAFSARSVRSARLIRDCARVTIGFVVVGATFLLITGEDRPVALFLGLVPTVALLTVASSAAVFERLLERAVDLQSDNDLTV
ncbi:MAG: DUF2975 domain-containing protein [Acidimicrobiales bacterium]